VRFAYEYPAGSVRLTRADGSSLVHDAFQVRSIRELSTWPVPVPEQRLRGFADGEHWLFIKAGQPDPMATHFWRLVAAVSPERGHGHKVEVSHHRTSVWGLVHAWQYLEWGGDGDALPAAYPVWAMYEAIFGSLDAGKGVFSTTSCFRVGHVRLDGAAEEFAGELSEYLGPERDAAGRPGLKSRRRTIHFTVDVSIRDGRPLAVWSRGPTRASWHADAVHGLAHVADWRAQVDDLHGEPPPAKPPESELFCYLGRSSRGLQPAQVSSILDLKGWPSRRAKGLRPALTLRGRRPPPFEPKLRKHLGLIRLAGNEFLFDCRELGLREKLQVPADLEPLLRAWVSNFGGSG
jgi:hypothetical protein